MQMSLSNLTFPQTKGKKKGKKKIMKIKSGNNTGRREKGKLRCEACEGINEMDQHRRLSGTSYF